MAAANQPKYPILEEILHFRGLPFKPLYTNQEVAAIFETSIRTIQEWIASGKLATRDLPGKARFLAQDIEAFLVNSKQEARRGGR